MKPVALHTRVSGSVSVKQQNLAGKRPSSAEMTSSQDRGSESYQQEVLRNFLEKNAKI